MANNFISIQDAADLTKKSIQTIRRAIKAKHIKFRRDKTPQGFNYLIDKDSLMDFYKLNDVVSGQTGDTAKKDTITFKSDGETMDVDVNDFKTFVQTLQTMIAQHSEERQNFMRLVNTMQEKIFVLENQINLLKAPAAKKWYAFWK
ncbi:helix-turn-helix domain-containing protein [Candidatus Peregrinibacteria bacterium]|nr:helix-turn-helix domain-containing protein [Candidatus Peregrinibacteria bacterium]